MPIDYSSLLLKDLRKLSEYKKISKEHNKSKLNKKDLITLMKKLYDEQNLLDSIVKSLERNRKIRFVQDNIKTLTPLPTIEKKERSTLWKDIKKDKKKNRKIAKILYREKPSLELYLQRKEDKEKDPLRFIKVNDGKDNKFKVYYEDKEKKIKIKYKIIKLENGYRTYINNRQKTFRYKNKEDKYKTLYKAKMVVFDNIEDVFNKSNIE